MELLIPKCLKLLRNIQSWRRSSPTEVKEMVNQTIGEVLQPVLTRTWDGGGWEMAQKVRVSLRRGLTALMSVHSGCWYSWNRTAS